MDNRHWIVLFMVGIPGTFILGGMLYLYWRDKKKLREKRDRHVRMQRKRQHR